VLTQRFPKVIHLAARLSIAHAAALSVQTANPRL